MWVFFCTATTAASEMGLHWQAPIQQHRNWTPSCYKLLWRAAERKPFAVHSNMFLLAQIKHRKCSKYFQVPPPGISFIIYINTAIFHFIEQMKGSRNWISLISCLANSWTEFKTRCYHILCTAQILHLSPEQFRDLQTWMKSENPCEPDAENSHCMQDPPVQDSVTNSWFRCRPHDPCLVNTPAPGAKILHENINSIQK